MKFEEFKTIFESGSDTKYDSIKVTEYLPILEKKILAQKVVDWCVQETDQVKYCDYVYKIIATDLAIITNYTNLELSEDFDAFVDEYDFLVENKIIDYIKCMFYKDELSLVNEIIDEMIRNEINSHNRIENVISRTLNNLIEKLPNEKQISKLISKVGKEIKNFDPSKLQNLQGLMQNLK